MAKRLINQPTRVPDRKVGYAALAAVAASIVADLLVANIAALGAIDPNELEYLFIGTVTLAVGYQVKSADNA